MIYAAALDRSVSHSAFRLYAVLVAAMKGRCNKEFTPVSVERLKAQVPGVRGRPPGSTAFQGNLRELQVSGLIAKLPTTRQHVFLMVKLLPLTQDETPPGDLLHVLEPGDVAWTRTRAHRAIAEQSG